MIIDVLQAAIHARLHEIGISQHRAALDANLPQDAIRHVLAGHIPRIDRAEQIAKALGLDFYIGPPRDLQDLNSAPDNSEIATALGLPPEASAAEILAAITSLTDESLQKPRLWSAGALPDLRSLRRMLEETDQLDPHGPLSRAEDLIGDWPAINEDTLFRVAIAIRAIEISPLCSEAYLDLVHLLNLDVREKRQLADLAVDSAELLLGPEIFTAEKGNFWSAAWTRTYLKARAFRADIAYDGFDWQLAADEYKEIIDLDSNDNMGCRYPLMSCLLHIEDDMGLLKVLVQFEQETSAHMRYTQALFEFVQDGADSPQAHKFAKEGYAENTLIPTALLKYEQLLYVRQPDEGASDMDVEAQHYCNQFGPHWAAAEGAIDWLLQALRIEFPTNKNNKVTGPVEEPTATYHADAGLKDPAALAEGATKDDDPGPATRLVGVVELRAAAGDGTEVLDEKVIGHLSFRRQWLDRHAIDPTQCMMIGVRGESMEPLLPDGGSILVDRSRRRRLSGHVYVLRTNDGVVVKRLARGDDGQWQVLSDHPAWPPQPWDDTNEIIGEVRWAAQIVP